MPKYLNIDYNEFDKIMDRLYRHITKLCKMSDVYKFTHVYGPPRGGLPIAVHLSHHLNLEYVDNLDILFDDVITNANILIVDDIVDTGRTMLDIKFILDNIIEINPTVQYKLMAINYKSRADIKPELFYQEVDNDTWVVYPWEKCEDCEKESYEFDVKRLQELKNKTINDGKTIVTATQDIDLSQI